MHVRFMTAAAVLGLWVPLGASAATLIPTAEGVLVSRGGGYEPVTGPTEVAPTDCILVNPGGRGEVQFEDGSVKVVEPGQSACVSDLAALPVDAGAAGAAVAGGGVGIGSSALLVGGLAVAGGVGLVGAVASGGGSGNDSGGGGGGGNPASP